ncbi:hypothetical protein LRH25_13770 [Ideonella azotifigens]|nr:hypothetical protein [Ideonella azotifigens]MCD2341411.1 hypothetical protein [Ideonella azotifigens]
MPPVLSDIRASRGLSGGVAGGFLAVAACMALLAGAGQAKAQSPSVYYICPGNVFTNTITSKEAEQRGCKAREAQQPTTIAGPRVKAPAGPATTARSDGERVDSSEQKSRDTDARRILDDELRKEEAALEAMKREYNNGEPERRGDERNFQKYQDRVSDLKAAISRKEADVAALRRELGKLPS